ncbi:MAG: hypothetical protein ABI574_15325, partial [Burkholderiales bacterium]
MPVTKHGHKPDGNGVTQPVKSVKRTDRPDSVHHRARRRGGVTAIPLGRASLRGSVLPTRTLGRTALPTSGKPLVTCAYLALLRVEIARFTRGSRSRPDSSL